MGPVGGKQRPRERLLGSPSILGYKGKGHEPDRKKPVDHNPLPWALRLLLSPGFIL